MDTNEQHTKSLILELEAAKQDLIQVVNKALGNRNLSCYVLEPILSEICLQVKEGARQELIMERTRLTESTTAVRENCDSTK